ncbi:thiamine pyrophosphate-binding protein [Neorhizobium galegae]|uniref:thiamine pyrophosphate-dependent enzyme n=1 Tax=Neorhizobium galegae TaxID=399 RepID=UPI00062283D2|nr:thiamine pyrophosphate-dependent enzyme [Neorhizobium galegae]MCQ1768319.1 thiamine pyrophosphate-binding protein [Neorhizobium galegae]MCQ1847291.1 thiamine pyrophosphate-binding protein [Neorhizobium galegae]CDZ34542.1 Acetolactate synthase [Neorhizobium galegae bv. officinalis]
MTMTGGDSIAASLRAHHVDTVFGIPGAQLYGLFDALQRDGMRVITPRHEQTCAYMAFGYARACGNPGVYSVVPGPGVLNTGAALLTAWGCNEPVLCLTGQVPTAFLGKGRGHLHEMRDQRAVLAGIAKSAERADKAQDVSAAIAHAFREMRSLKPGPATVEMPWEQFVAEGEFEIVWPLENHPDPVADVAIGEAAAAIGRAERPMIFVGPGAFEARDEVLRLAQMLHAPVVGFRSGRGVVSNRHELGLTIAEARKLWPVVDCVIGIGTRLEVPSWRWKPRTEVPVVRLEIDAEELTRTPEALGVLGRAKTSLTALLAELRPRTPSDDWRQAIRKARAQTAQAIQEISPHYGYLQAIRAALPDDGILVEEVCQAGFASWYCFPVYEPRTFVSTGFQGTLGFGFPTALGVKVARPDVPVVSISGDGGFMFAAQELATAAQYGIDVIAVVFNNSAFGNVKRDQSDAFGGRLIGSELKNPDFDKLAAAFHVDFARVSAPEDLRTAIETAIARGGPWLIEVPLDLAHEVSPWTFIHG